MIKPAGVILAGGQARRMGGGDKGVLRIGDRRLIDHVISRITPQVADVALNANGDAARFADLGLPVLPDSIDGFAGPLAGVLAGMDWAAEQHHKFILTVAADTPFFPHNLCQLFQEVAGETGAAIVLAATPDPMRGSVRHPTFGLWSVALRDDLRAALTSGIRKVVQWTDRHPNATALFSGGPVDPFFNVNTPDDLDKAKAIAAEGAA